MKKFLAITISSLPFLLISTGFAADKVVVVPLNSTQKNPSVSPNQRCPGKSSVIGIDADGNIICNHKIVFISSQIYTGDLGGRSGADAICTNLASTAGLPGEYKAWLSTYSEYTPISRFNKDAGSYIMTNGSVVAHNFHDLTDGHLITGISRDEYGQFTDGFVWTNTNADGSENSSAQHCSYWYSSDPGDQGAFGASGSATDVWTNYLDNVSTCDTPLRLYCFQQ